MVFRRRRRDAADPEARHGSEGGYLAADELAEDEDYRDDDELADDEDYREDDEPAGLGDPGEDQAGPGYAAAAEPGGFGSPDAGEPAEGTGDETEARPTAPASGRADLGDPATWTRLRDSAVVKPAHVRSAGPWDSADDFPEAERIDLGSMLVPVGEGLDVQIGYSEETGITVGVVSADSMLQLQAFAAPRSSGLWDDVRPEIVEEVAKAGGRAQQDEGSFGPELLAWITPVQEDGTPAIEPQPLRFLGADGPRWFLRGLISGPAAIDPEQAQPLEDAFADVVVVRGDHAEPPRKPLDIQLPEQARQLFEEQAEAQEQGLPNPFERGPEITETR